MSTAPVRIAIVEDHQLLAELIELECSRAFAVVSNDQTGRAALKSIESHQPDVVLLDLGMPDMEARALISSTRRVAPRAKIIAVTAQCNPANVQLIQESQLDGYVDKVTDGLKRIPEAVNAALAGVRTFPSWIRQALDSLSTMPHSFAKVLNKREQRVLALIGQSENDEQIARAMGYSVYSAQACRSRIMRKLGLPGTPALIRYAIENGFTRLPGAEGLVRKLRADGLLRLSSRQAS